MPPLSSLKTTNLSAEKTFPPLPFYFLLIHGFDFGVVPQRSVSCLNGNQMSGSLTCLAGSFGSRAQRPWPVQGCLHMWSAGQSMCGAPDRDKRMSTLLPSFWLAEEDFYFVWLPNVNSWLLRWLQGPDSDRCFLIVTDEYKRVQKCFQCYDWVIY